MNPSHSRRALLAGICTALLALIALGVRRRPGPASAAVAAPASARARSWSPETAPSAASPSPAATRSAGCRTPLRRSGTCAGGRRSARPLEGRPRRDPVRAELPAEAEPVPAAGAAVRGLPVPERLHADVAPRTRSGRCSCGSTAAASPRTAPSTTTAPSSRRTASSSSRSTTGSARSASSRIRRSPRGRAGRPATTA